MRISDLVFIGIKGSVIALDRATGEQVWATHLKGYDFVNVLVEDGKVFATCYGEVFCLNPLTGEGLWHNRLKGLGTGLATIATEDTLRSTLPAVLAEKHRRDQEAAASAAGGATVAAA
jgi:outer membrane protein assembly factor BamB